MTQKFKKNECNFCRNTNLGESTLCPPPKLQSQTQKNLHLVFCSACGHRILDYFCSFQVYSLILDFNYFILKEILTNIYELEHMKYICVEINMLQSMKNCKYISKLRLWTVKFCSEFFFVVNDIFIHQLNLIPFKSLKILIKNPFKKSIFLHL